MLSQKEIVDLIVSSNNSTSQNTDVLSTENRKLRATVGCQAYQLKMAEEVQKQEGNLKKREQELLLREEVLEMGKKKEEELNQKEEMI